MTRRLTIIALLGLGALGPGAGMALATPAPRAQLRGFVCRRALNPPNRAISIRAVMRPRPGTRRLELRFDLLARGPAPASAPSLVRAGDLGMWISPPNPTLGQRPGDVWKVDKPVVELGAPATYRFRVGFRWIGARSKVLGSTVRYSPTCHQPELRPDLLVRSIFVTPIAQRPQHDFYTVVIANAGATGAGPFDVLFAPADGSTPKTRTVLRLRAHRSLIETFVGPLCTAAAAPTVTVDSASQVDDLNRANNQLTAVCPAPAAP